jgi:predicted glutamine amidotransferase
MCRFVLYLGEEIMISTLVTEPAHSILQQSFQAKEREEPLNGDGFGIAWYPQRSREPAVLKEVNPAWNSLNLRNVAKVTSTTCLLAHVRAATPGLPVHQLNCHPFSWGELSFMHNGAIGGFSAFKQELVGDLQRESFLDIDGSTDSEHLFALVKEAWIAGEGHAPLARLETALREAIERSESLRVAAGQAEPSYLNLVLSDGRCAVVTRYVSGASAPAASLYLNRGARYACEDGVCRAHETGGGGGAVIVASEPLGPDPGWQPVPENHLVRIDEHLGVDVVAIESGA